MAEAPLQADGEQSDPEFSGAEDDDSVSIGVFSACPSATLAMDYTGSGDDAIYGPTPLLLPFDVEGPKFRLLSIKPGSDSDPVYCNIVRRPIYDNYPDYAAISYSWGTDPESAMIHVGRSQTEMPVKPHVLQVLRHIRHQKLPVLVWVDTICIDQKNPEERAFQVGLMDQIFNQAAQVIIWLGESRPLGTDCEENADIIADLCSRQNPWWSRLWVLQEVTYSQLSPVLLLGSQRCDMSTFLKKWNEVLEKTRLGTDPSANEAYKLLVELYASWQDGSNTARHRTTILQRLRQTRHRQCTEPLDRVYALLSMILEDEAQKFRADYDRSTVDLFKAVESHVMNHDVTIDDLSMISGFAGTILPGFASRQLKRKGWTLHDFNVHIGTHSCQSSKGLNVDKTLAGVPGDLPCAPPHIAFVGYDQFERNTYVELANGELNYLRKTHVYGRRYDFLDWLWMSDLQNSPWDMIKDEEWQRLYEPLDPKKGSRYSKSVDYMWKDKRMRDRVREHARKVGMEVVEPSWRQLLQAPLTD